VRRLQEAGHEALFAGGCVRDMLMQRDPSDYDVATSAHPEIVVSLFRRTQKVGAKFGVILVHEGRHTIEVATFRRDLEYADGRRPTGVEYTTAKEDALRRDFTINGMFFDPIKNEVVDYVDGREDIQRRVVRAIGDPPRRFAEDHLRLIRAVRFAARLGFEIEPATWAAMQNHAPEIATISPERIREELEAILIHPNRAVGFMLLVDSGVLAHCWPKAKQIVEDAERIRIELDALPPDAPFESALGVAFAMLSEDDVEATCDALRCSNYTKKTVMWLCANRTSLDHAESLTLADLKLLMANPAFAQVISICSARVSSKSMPSDAFDTIKKRVARIPLDEVAPPPLLTGHDLEALGLQPGPAYKAILDRVYYAQLNHDIQGREEALAMAVKQL
jgi:poly(A) polymerase